MKYINYVNSGRKKTSKGNESPLKLFNCVPI